MDVRASIRNLTPHRVVITTPEEDIGFISEGEPYPRARVHKLPYGELVVPSQYRDVRVPIWYTRTGEVLNLPEPEEGTLFIVSRVVAEALPNRDDLLFPDDLVRDKEGRVIGAKGLSRIYRD